MTVHTLATSAQRVGPKPTIAFSTSVRTDQLDEAARKALFQELWPICSRIFDGPGLHAMVDALAHGKLGKTTMQRYYDADGRCVGFATLLCDEFEQDGEQWSVFRAMTGLLPEYRKRQRVMSFYISVLGAYLLRNPRRRVFFFTPVVHISSYRLLARHAAEMYPHPDQPTPPRMLELMQGLGARYGCTPVEGEHPLVCRRSVKVRSTPGTKEHRLAQGDALDRFFQQINPRFSEGLCVMSLAPVTLGQVVTGALRYARTRVSVLLRELGSTRKRGAAAQAT
jgi:hypothetical protein